MSQESKPKWGILISDAQMPKYLVGLIQKMQAADLNVQGVTLNSASSARTFGVIHRLLTKLIIALDGRYLRWTSFRGHLNRETNRQILDASVPESRLNQHSLDYVISLDGSLISPAILKSTKKGGLILEAGIPLKNGISFFGFREVFSKKAATQFRILHQSPDGTLENVLVGNLLTQSSFLLNQSYVAHKGLHYLEQYLMKVSANPNFTWPHLQANLQTPDSRSPRAWDLFSYIVKRLYRNAQQKISALKNFDQQWNVAFQMSDWHSMNLAKGQAFDMGPDQFFADPFVIQRDGKQYCFVEEFDFKTNLGHISVFEILADGAKPLGHVLKEPFHLSFPYLFEYNNELYMCPEASGAREIRIYKCHEFPLSWKFEKAIKKEVSAVDSMLFEHNGLWWMLTNIDPLQKNDHCTELVAFYADSPLSETWTPHPLNPLRIDPLNARNGGLLRKQGNLFRVSQSQKFGIYGAQSRIHQILELSANQYSEKTTQHNEPEFFEGIFGTHHMHSNGVVTVYDFCKMAQVKR